MSELAARYVTIYPKIATGFSTEINAAVSKGANAGGKAVGAGVEQGVREAAPKMGSVFKSVVAPILTGAALVKVVDFVGKSVSAFSELQDTTAAAGVIFGDSMDKIIAKSKEGAATLGMSESQVIDAANTFGTLGKSANLSGDNLADFSNQMTDVAGSLASFKGGSVEDAIIAVGSALRGEQEPIRRYGILLDDATLRQRAMTLGIIDNVKSALTPQQKVLAAQAEILAQSGDAMGDFTRTADSTANVQKRLQAETANLTAEIGEKLAPAITEAQKAGIGFLSFISANMTAIVPLVATMGTLTAAVGGFVLVAKGVEALKSARDTLNSLGDAFQGMSTKAKVATVSAGAIGVALTAAAIVYGVFAQANADAQQRVESLTDAIKADNGVIGENTRATAANSLEKRGLLEAGQKLGLTTADVVSASLGEADAMARVQAAIALAAQGHQDVANATQEQITKYDDAATAGAQLGRALNGSNTEIQQAVAAEARLKEGISGSTSATTANTIATQTNTGANKSNADSLDKVYRSRLQLRADKRSFEQAIDDASAALKKNGKTLDDNTQKGRDNQDALDAIVARGRDWVQGLKDTERPQSEINAAMKETRADFIRAATAMGMGSTEAAKLASKIGAIKDPAEKARDKLAALAKKAKELDGQNVQISVSASMNRSADEIVYKTSGGGSMKFTAKAFGGPITGGVPGKDSVLSLLMPEEHVLTTEDVRNLGGHAGVYRMRALAKQGVMRFASGGPVAPSYKGHSLEWWQDYLLSDIDLTRLQIQIRDLQSSLKEKETYNPPGKKKKATRMKLRGLDKVEAEQELADARERLELAKEAANANSSAQGTIAEQIQNYNDAAGMWQSAAESLTKSAGLGSLDAASVKRTNAVGDVWFEKRNQTAADLASRVNDQANQVLTFVNLLGQLRAAGASEALISDVMALGTVDGTKAAQLFLSDSTQRAVAEAGYAKLASAQSQLNAIGNAAAGISVTINEAATPQATSQAVINGILAART